MRDGGGQRGRGLDRREFRLRRLQPLRRRAFDVCALAGKPVFGAGMIEQRLDQVRRKFPLSARKLSTWSRSQASSGMA
jgi:hypothetical protein